MVADLPTNGAWRLEGLCKPPRDRIRSAVAAPGIERLEAHLQGQAFAPHRHDTYAVGITLAGVQTFGYRGERWRCLPGQCHVLHPDETHDGAAGSDAGFAYRIIYLDPTLVQQALGGAPLPFAARPVVDAARLPPGFAADVWAFDTGLDEQEQVDLVAAVTALLLTVSDRPVQPARRLPLRQLARVHAAIAACPTERRTMAEYERMTGLDRWTIARQFRAAYGTSPSRFRTMRQLDQVRRLLAGGQPLAAAASAAGFADQAHMTRHFKAAYGRTPGRWAAVALTGGAASP